MTDSAPLDTAPQVLIALLEALGLALPFVILRNYEGLPETWGNDVDILIHPSDLPAAREIALGILRRSLHFPAARMMERLNFWSVNLPCTDRALVIDFTSAMTRRWFIYADTEVIFAARRRAQPLFCIPDPLHELLLIAAKELFAYGRIRSRYHRRLAGHEAKASLAAALKLFSGRLTEKGCRLVARALEDPTVTGKPELLWSALIKPGAMLEWAYLRMSGHKPIFLENAGDVS